MEMLMSLLWAAVEDEYELWEFVAEMPDQMRVQYSESELIEIARAFVVSAATAGLLDVMDSASKDVLSGPDLLAAVDDPDQWVPSGSGRYWASATDLGRRFYHVLDSNMAVLNDGAFRPYVRD